MISWHSYPSYHCKICLRNIEALCRTEICSELPRQLGGIHLNERIGSLRRSRNVVSELRFLSVCLPSGMYLLCHVGWRGRERKEQEEKDEILAILDEDGRKKISMNEKSEGEGTSCHNCLCSLAWEVTIDVSLPSMVGIVYMSSSSRRRRYVCPAVAESVKTSTSPSSDRASSSHIYNCHPLVAEIVLS